MPVAARIGQPYRLELNLMALSMWLWGAVFPLGMYAVATWQMDHAMEFGFLSGLSRTSLYISAGAWVITFLGMLRAVLRGAKSQN